MTRGEEYRLILHANVEKQLTGIPKVYARRLVDVMRSLRNDPRPIHSKHLGGGLYRIREGDYRLIYAVFDEERVVFVGKVGRRSEKMYRDLSSLLTAARKAVGGK
jgi:mRNA interferase RelE/StbE